MGGDILIELKNVSFSYGSSSEKSITDFSLDIKKGECVLLAGRSGCGKTTVTRLMNGLIPQFYSGNLEGEVLIEGENIRDLTMDKIAEKVGSVFQDPRSQFFTTDTTSEIAFSCENMGYSQSELLERVSRTVCELQMEKLINRSIFELSSGEKQRVAIASVYALTPSIYVMDEPSANLDFAATERLKEILTALKEKGCTILISEHRLYYLRNLVDKVVNIEQGKKVQEYTREQFLHITDYERQQMGLRCLYPERLDVQYKAPYTGSSERLDIKSVSFYYKDKRTILDSISFSAQQGEIIGILGENGAGKSTLAGVVSGLLKERGGQVFWGTKQLKKGKRSKYTYSVMQDADYQLFTESVEEELKLGLEDTANLSDRVVQVLEELNLREVRTRHPSSLSGGQKQRVTIGAALMKNAKIILMDEPTSGLDADNMVRVSNQLRRIAESGRAVFVISHDYEFILQCCTRVIYLEQGKITEDFAVNPSNLKRLQEIFL